ncbi:MAG: hypothetical protein FWG89_00305 [Treponema sp.]|nr:hypothetical protein [Treponema sp.]
MRFNFLAVATLSILSCVTAGESIHDSPDHVSGEESTVRITGRVQIYGNEPFTFVGIIDEDNAEYAVYPPSVADELRSLQGYVIEFTVILPDEPQGDNSMFLLGRTVTPVSWRVIER